MSRSHKYLVQYPIQIECGLKCPYCLHKEAWDLKSENKYEDKFSHDCAFTFEQYQQWRDKHLADATDILMDLHGGEMSYGDNRQLVLDIIDKADKERIVLQTNGLGERNFYMELVKRKDKIERIGFTYHRMLLQDNTEATAKYKDNVLFMAETGINVYVKELLIPEYKDKIISNKEFWEGMKVNFHIQDYRGIDGSSPPYNADDVKLIHPEYHHILGAECSCRAGYKNIIIRGYDINAYAFGGDILACWQDPCVVGNINEDWYNPDYTIHKGFDNKLDVNMPKKIYRGNYPRDLRNNEYTELNKYQLKQRGKKMAEQITLQDLTIEREKLLEEVKKTEGMIQSYELMRQRQYGAITVLDKLLKTETENPPSKKETSSSSNVVSRKSRKKVEG